MTSLSSSQERNAKALEVSGRLVSQMVVEAQQGMFNQSNSAAAREHIRAQVASEVGDLVKKIAAEIVVFI
jgi:hypothetical protein